MKNFGKHGNFVGGRADELGEIQNLCTAEEVMSSVGRE